MDMIRSIAEAYRATESTGAAVVPEPVFTPSCWGRGGAFMWLFGHPGMAPQIKIKSNKVE